MSSVIKRITNSIVSRVFQSRVLSSRNPYPTSSKQELERMRIESFPFAYPRARDAMFFSYASSYLADPLPELRNEKHEELGKGSSVVRRSEITRSLASYLRAVLFKQNHSRSSTRPLILLIYIGFLEMELVIVADSSFDDTFFLSFFSFCSSDDTRRNCLPIKQNE